MLVPRFLTRRFRRAPSGRAVVLGAVAVLLVVLIAAPLERWLASRTTLHQAAVQLQHDRQQLGDLEHQQARWGDPGYVQHEARLRLQYAMPGDRTYVVVHAGDKTRTQAASRARKSAPPAQSWNQRLWRSVQQADASQ